MTKKISDSWEWNLTAAQKNMVCWAFGALGLVAMVFYSFPNTVLFFVQAISLPLAPEFVSRAVAVSLAIFNNGLELAAMYLLIWKIKHITSAILAAGIMAITGFFSVVGTFGSLETSDQQLAAERKKSEYLAAETANIQESINQKSQLLAANNQQILDLQLAGKNASTRLYNRSLELSQEIDRLTVQLRERGQAAAKQAIRAPKSVLKPEQKRKFNLWFSPVIELLMLLCTAISVLVYKEIKEDAGETIGFEVRGGGEIEAIPAAARRSNPAVGFDFSDVSGRTQKRTVSGVSADGCPDGRTVSTLTVSGVSADEIPDGCPGVRTDAKTDEILRKIYNEKFRGKSDSFILFVWDNWRDVGAGERSLRKVARAVEPILPGRQKISHQYVDRVIRQNRGGGGAR
jgi:hypothetical protein